MLFGLYLIRAAYGQSSVFVSNKLTNYLHFIIKVFRFIGTDIFLII